MSQCQKRNFWALWCKGRLTQTDTLTIKQGATPSGLTSATSTIPHFFTGRMPFLPPNQQCQSTEGQRQLLHSVREKSEMLEFSSTLLPAPSPYPGSCIIVSMNSVLTDQNGTAVNNEVNDNETLTRTHRTHLATWCNGEVWTEQQILQHTKYTTSSAQCPVRH